MAELRFGRVSSIDYETGRVSVYYSDRSKCVTDYLPMVSNGIYIMPKIGAKVAVIHLTHDLSQGVVLGTLWEGANQPTDGSPDVIRFALDGETAFIKYDKVDKILTVKAPTVIVQQAEPEPLTEPEPEQEQEGGGE